MSGHLLDTSIVSALAPDRRGQSEALLAWLRRGEPLYLPVVAIAEIEQGICKLRRAGGGERAERLSGWLERLIDQFGDRMLHIDTAVARRAGALSDQAKAAGNHPGFADVLIAATVTVHGLAVATLNTRHFTPLGIDCVDPSAEPLS
ncbi:type II toxin-antitoxin system VapC family toxin [Xanthobacteraceae bacterium Astr-EGSB]|uniref:type II toxin-antitoxin system VapC family toxin n=1 Tax=Astrobacterium formosum TaxID=3069710 RepID=UPI0027B382CA|nr:type II toxin-antitoxin system VapC family toxin [Xanthobacteraceae bacterium Astr-EGSB]